MFPESREARLTTATQPPRLDAKPISRHVGAEITGVDLRRALSPALIDDLRRMLAERGVVIFTGQELDPAGHLALARQLGEIRMPHQHLPSLAEDGLPEIGVLRYEPGKPFANIWHTDVTWAEDPPRYSILHLQVNPSVGGDTMWASAIKAYERLSPPMQQLVSDLTAYHEFFLGDRPSAVHPVVHRHPITGRRALFVNPQFTKRIVELDEAESAAVLNLLFEKIIQPESTCRWRWNDGDVAIWDNHFVLHYNISDDIDSLRVIHRIEIRGDAPIPAGRVGLDGPLEE
jgi:taurine dioxygenase